MQAQVLEVLNCPICSAALAERGPAVLECETGHQFPVTDGVPRLLPEQLGASATVHDSFTAEWEAFDYDDRTWGATVEQRREEFLRHVNLTADQLHGKRVLDAGCGNGTLSQAISSLGCEVVACDLSEQPIAAHRHFKDRPGTYYLQADLTRPPFKPGTFDVVFCAGVLHHTADTRTTFEQVVPALAPGGTIFVWLYHHVPGRVLAVKSLLRRGLSRLPARVKAAVVATVILPQAMVRQYIRGVRRQLGERDRHTWRERYVILLDSYTPRYRWEHTPEELAGWYREHGFVDIKTTELGPWGFGVAARKPG